MAQPTAEQLVDAIERLTKAVEANTGKATKGGSGSGGPANKAVDANAPEWLQKIDSFFGMKQDLQNAAGGISSGSIGGTISGLRSAYRLYKEFSGGKAAGGASRAAEGGAEGHELASSFGGAGAAENAGMAGEAAGLGAIAGPAAIVVAVLAALAIAFVKFKNHVEKATDALLEEQAKMGEISGSMAAVFAERELSELTRDRKKGDTIAGSAAFLAQSEQYRKGVQAEFDVLGTRLSNVAEGIGNRVLASAYQWLGIDKIVRVLNRILDVIEPRGDGEAVADWLQRIEDSERQRLIDAKDRMRQLGADRERLRQRG